MKNRHFTTLFSALLFSATVSLQAGYAGVQAPATSPQAEQERPAELGLHKGKLDRQKGDVDKRKQGDVDKKKPRAKDKLRKKDKPRGKDKPQKGGEDQTGRTGGADHAQLKQTLLQLKLKKALLQQRLQTQNATRGEDRDKRGRLDARGMGQQRQALRENNAAPQSSRGLFRGRNQAQAGQRFERVERADRQELLKTLRERTSQRGSQLRSRRGAR